VSKDVLHHSLHGRVVRKSIGNGTIWGAAAEKPLGMAIGSGGDPPRRGEMLMVCAFLFVL